MMDLDDETEWIKAFSEKIDALKLPGNALDMLIDDLGGFNKIAEMSGRSERLVRNYKGEFLCGNQIYGAFVLNRRVDLHAIDATPARWRGDVGSSPLDGASAATSSPRNDLVKTRHTG